MTLGINYFKRVENSWQLSRVLKLTLPGFYIFGFCIASLEWRLLIPFFVLLVWIVWQMASLVLRSHANRTCTAKLMADMPWFRWLVVSLFLDGLVFGLLSWIEDVWIMFFFGLLGAVLIYAFYRTDIDKSYG